VKFLQDFDAKGVVDVRRLRLFGLPFQQASSPVRLNGGVLEFSSITADLCGGDVTARIRLNAKESLGIDASAQAGGVDLRLVSDELKTAAAYQGKASVRLELAGVARSRSDIPAGLSGSFFFEAGSGGIQARKHLQKAAASPTRFDKIVISGPVERGVFHSDRFQIDGPALNAEGGGWVNLSEKTLDLKLEARLAGLPAFPMRVYGTMDKPQTSVQAGQAIVNTVGRLGLRVADGIEAVGSGLLDVVGSVLSVPFKLLKQ
jgi:uncharacterized protein involved in outer membrane biogenesis